MPKANPNEAKVVRLTNIFDFDYTHAYGGVPYQLRAGVTQLFPWAIGDHLATHLARQAIIRKAPYRDENATDGRGGESTRSDRPLWDENAINDLKAKIIQDAYTEEREAPVSEAEMYRRKFEELNRLYPAQAVAPMVPPANQVAPTVPGAVVGTTSAPDITAPTVYQDKAEVIAALVAKNVPHNPRASKANLEKLLQ